MGLVAKYSALQDSCPLERVNKISGSQALNSVMVHDTKAIRVYIVTLTAAYSLLQLGHFKTWTVDSGVDC